MSFHRAADKEKNHINHTFYKMSFDAEGPVGQKIKPILTQELINRYRIPDEAEDVAEFLLVLIAGNKTPPEIISEVKEVVDVPIDEGFISSLFGEIKNITEQLQGGQQGISSIPQQPAQTQQPPQQTFVPQPQPAQQQGYPEDEDTSMQEDRVDFRALPNRPQRLQKGPNAGRVKAGGIGKQRNNNVAKKSFGVQNAANFEKALNFGDNNTKFVTRPPKGRCHKFPNCHNRDCKFSHPTKVCNNWPDCPNPPGTCNFLHPNEDQELMAKLEVSKQEYLEKRRNTKHRPSEPIATGISICKYGALCSKELCPFGHPTPANIEAKVIDIVWCEDGKKCQNNSCRKAHPSPGYLAPPPEPTRSYAPAGGHGGHVERILEQCKFGMNCTNIKCPRRHATSGVPCKNGAECQRIDCTFAHPINEDCRFGSKCTNKNCLYRHSDGRAAPTNTWVRQENNTDERMFAVPEDQVMERAEQPSIV